MATNSTSLFGKIRAVSFEKGPPIEGLGDLLEHLLHEGSMLFVGANVGGAAAKLLAIQSFHLRPNILLAVKTG